MTSDDLMARLGAVWCEEHNRWECKHSSRRRPGDRCHGSPVRGTPTCYTHSGKRLATLKAEGEAMTAWSALEGTPTVSATEAVLGMLQMSWLRVHLYASLLEKQVTEAAEAADGDGLFPADSTGAGGVGRGAGLIGHTYAAGKDVGVFASGEAIRGLAQLEAQERDRCVRFAKTAHDMGIAEIQVKIAEQQGAMFAAAINRILDGLGLSAEQRARVPQVVPVVLRELAQHDATSARHT